MSESDLLFRFATRDLKHIKELSHYNNNVHELKNSKFCFTHIKEIYNDVDDSPFYEFGVLDSSGWFECLFTGEGESIPKGKENTGGVYFNVYIHYPEFLNLKNDKE